MTTGVMRPIARARVEQHKTPSYSPASNAHDGKRLSRRAAACVSLTACALTAARAPARARSDCESCSDSNSALRDEEKAFVKTITGLRVLDLRIGEGEVVEKVGTKVVVDWSGYTSGYQAKKIESTRETDNPFVFAVGDGRAIPAFDEAVRGMRVGGVRRIEIPGELEEVLGYSRNKGARYDGVGPKPSTFGGQRALDFVLDNETLQDFNRSLLFDIRLSSVRK